MRRLSLVVLMLVVGQVYAVTPDEVNRGIIEAKNQLQTQRLITELKKSGIPPFHSNSLDTMRLQLDVLASLVPIAMPDWRCDIEYCLAVVGGRVDHCEELLNWEAAGEGGVFDDGVTTFIDAAEYWKLKSFEKILAPNMFSEEVALEWQQACLVLARHSIIRANEGLANIRQRLADSEEMMSGRDPDSIQRNIRDIDWCIAGTMHANVMYLRVNPPVSP